tara:strand:+ start:1430 stop:2527 length:1098 start_codon:yes stop_codon:yes gene_type:complete
MKLVVILACMSRGGIDFFQSLLDQHSEISQFPGSFYVDEFLKIIKNERNSEIIARKFIENYEEFFDSRSYKKGVAKVGRYERHNYLGEDKKSYYTVDKSQFKNNFIKIIKEETGDIRKVIIALNLAYSKASGEDLDKKKLVVLNLHHFFRFNSIKNIDFDIVCTIRDPIDSYSSFMKNLAYYEQDYLDAWRFNFHLERTFSHLKKTSELKKKTFVIKLEDLHLKNSGIMNNFCKTFNIKYENVMENSTYHGFQWWGDSLVKKDLRGINKNFRSNIDDKFFYQKDICYIEKKLENFYKKYGYPKRCRKSILLISYFLPLKVEIINFKESLKRFNFKNFIFCIYYYLKRISKFSETEYSEKQYPRKL